MNEQNEGPGVDGTGGVRVDRPVRPVGGEPSQTWMNYIRHLEKQNTTMAEILKQVDQVITVEASLQPDKEYGWIEWLNENVRPWLAQRNQLTGPAVGRKERDDER